MKTPGKIQLNEFKLFADFDSKSYAFEFDYNGKLYKSHIINRILLLINL